MNTTTTTTKGTIVSPDDLDIDSWYTVHGTRDGEFVPIGGMALQCKAVELPYVVLHNVMGQPLTLDIRHFDLMRVSDTFVKAQKAA